MVLENRRVSRHRRVYACHVSDPHRLYCPESLVGGLRPGKDAGRGGLHPRAVCVRGAARVRPRADGGAIRHQDTGHHPVADWRSGALERMPDEPLQELWVALAGPAVNVVIAAALFVLLQFTNAWAPLEQLSVASGPFLQRLMVVNVILVVFNMLPAFPMDGGRVLRALLATRLEYTRATQIAASIGQSMALVFGFLGFFYNPFLMFIALFVWIGAAQEASMAQMKSSLAGIPVMRAMITDFQTLTPHDPLARATERILAGSQQDFPVVDDGQVVGILTRHDLLVGLTQHGQDTLVGDTMQREFETVDASEMLETAFRRLQSCQCHTVPVLQRGELVGLVTMDNVGEFVAIQAAEKDFAAAKRETIHVGSD